MSDGDTKPMSLRHLTHRVRDYYYYSCCSYYFPFLFILDAFSEIFSPQVSQRRTFGVATGRLSVKALKVLSPIAYYYLLSNNLLCINIHLTGTQ